MKDKASKFSQQNEHAAERKADATHDKEEVKEPPKETPEPIIAEEEKKK